MAGDWIKMRSDLLTHPKVVRISSALKADRLRIAGGLFAVWCLFDTHSIDGQLDGYTPEALDELIGFPGFSAAMAAVGWLECNGDHLATPRFEEHNGQSAKRRAQETERKRTVRKTSAPDADKKRTREEKRREEPSSLRSEGKPRSSASPPKPEDVAEQVWTDWQQLRKGKKAAVTETVLNQARSEAEKAHLSLNDFLAVWCARGSQGLQADWLKPSERGSAQPNGETAYQRSMRERMQQIVPGIAARAPGVSNVIEMEAADVTPRRLDR